MTSLGLTRITALSMSSLYFPSGGLIITILVSVRLFGRLPVQLVQHLGSILLVPFIKNLVPATLPTLVPRPVLLTVRGMTLMLQIPRVPRVRKRETALTL